MRNWHVKITGEDKTVAYDDTTHYLAVGKNGELEVIRRDIKQLHEPLQLVIAPGKWEWFWLKEEDNNILEEN